jgi:hypothetical protein
MRYSVDVTYEVKSGGSIDEAIQDVVHCTKLREKVSIIRLSANPFYDGEPKLMCDPTPPMDAAPMTVPTMAEPEGETNG